MSAMASPSSTPGAFQTLTANWWPAPTPPKEMSTDVRLRFGFGSWAAMSPSPMGDHRRSGPTIQRSRKSAAAVAEVVG